MHAGMHGCVDVGMYGCLYCYVIMYMYMSVCIKMHMFMSRYVKVPKRIHAPRAYVCMHVGMYVCV